MIDYTKLLLQKRFYEELKTNARDVNFYVKVLQKENEESVKLCMLIDNIEEQKVTTQQIQGMAAQIERNLLLKGFRHVDVMCMIFSTESDQTQELLESDIRFWLINVKDKKLVIFDNQPEDYEAIKGPMEYELAYGAHQQIKRKVRRRNTRYVTWALVIINIVIFFILNTIGDVYNTSFMLKMGANDWTQTFQEHQYYRLITCMFLHFGIEHLGSNMFMLAVVGNQIETALGSMKFFVVYMISGIGASIVSSIYYMMSVGEEVVSAGASGAIFGIMGAMAAMAFKDRNKIGSNVGRRMVIILILVVIDGTMSANIDYMAHLGGLIVGFILTMFIYKEDARYAGYKR